MRAEGNTATIFETLDELRRSWWTLVAGMCLGIAGALIALNYSPKVYEATTLSRIAPPQISEELMQSMVTEDLVRRLLVVQDAILSRPYMVKLVEQTYGPSASEEELQARIERLREDVEVTTDRDAGMFSLTYRNSDPQFVADVVNTLTRLCVEANRDSRREQSGQTVETFDRLVAEARGQFETAERALNEYKGRHPFQTEQYLDFNQREKENRVRELEANRIQQQAVQERLRRLEVQLNGTDWSTPGAAGLPDSIAVDPLTRRIRDLQTELENLRARYTENHPNVEQAKKRLEELTTQAQNRPVNPGPDGAGPAVPQDPARAALQAQIDVVRQELAGLVSAESRISQKIAEVEQKIHVTPDIQRRLTELQNAYNMAENRLRDFQSKAVEAGESHGLEVSDQGERIEVLEWAIVPTVPVSPQPPRVLALGLTAGLLIFVGPLVLRRLLNPIVVSESGLKAITDVPLLVSIPRLDTRDNRGLSRRRLFKNLSFSVVSTAVLAAVMWTLQ